MLKENRSFMKNLVNVRAGSKYFNVSLKDNDSLSSFCKTTTIYYDA